MPGGLDCYKMAYWVTFGAGLAAVGISLWSIRFAHVKEERLRQAERPEA